MTTLHRIRQAGVIPVMVVDEPEQTLAAVAALTAGGLSAIEITLRTEAALQCLAAVRKEFPQLLLGAGTVLSLEQAQQVAELGADFIISPGLDSSLADWCSQHKLPYIPGCVTPTEITACRKLGLHTVKFFPAQVFGGIQALRALAAPFPDISFIPTGGIGPSQLDEYLSAPFVWAIGGSWLVKAQDIAAGDYDRIQALAEEASSIVSKYRGDSADE